MFLNICLFLLDDYEDIIMSNVKNKMGNALALGVAVAAPTVAFAAEAPDVSEVVSYLGLAVVAIGAIGAAKMIPSAAIWLWSTLSSAVRRG